MKNEALETAAAGASAVAGAKSAATAVTSGVGTAVMSVVDGSNWATWIGVAVTVITCLMTWYFKKEERARAQRLEALERTDYEQKQRERDVRISLMLAGHDPDKMPKTESQLAELNAREVANG